MQPEYGELNIYRDDPQTITTVVEERQSYYGFKRGPTAIKISPSQQKGTNANP